MHSTTIKVPIKLPNKSNSNEIRFSPRFWARVEGLVKKMRREGSTRLYWIGPSTAVKRAEEVFALFLRNEEKRTWGPDEKLGLHINLMGQKIDVDGVKALLDGIEKSGRISNDRQFRELHIKHYPAKHPSVEFSIESLEEGGSHD